MTLALSLLHQIENSRVMTAVPRLNHYIQKWVRRTGYCPVNEQALPVHPPFKPTLKLKFCLYICSVGFGFRKQHNLMTGLPALH